MDTQDGSVWNLRIATTDIGRLPERIARRLVTPRIEGSALVYRGIPAHRRPEDIVPELAAHGLAGAWQTMWSESRG